MTTSPELNGSAETVRRLKQNYKHGRMRVCIDLDQGDQVDLGRNIYGYTLGTEAYRMCADREASYRRQGRMSANEYSQSRVIADAQAACASCGLSRGSDRFDRCVQREVEYRRPN